MSQGRKPGYSPVESLIGDTKVLEYMGQSTEKREKHRENFGVMYRVPSKYSAECQSIYANEEEIQGLGKNNMKRTEETIT